MTMSGASDVYANAIIASKGINFLPIVTQLLEAKASPTPWQHVQVE